MSIDSFGSERVKAGMRGSEATESGFVEGFGQGTRALEIVIRELARSDVPVLLLAERGAGKKATAERIHQMSERRQGTFQVVCCAEVPEKQLTNNRNGHGLFAGGTVYLEEIADLS